MSSGPHPSVPLTQAQIAQQQQAQAHAHELAKRRSRKPTDKNIPEGVEDSIVDEQAVRRYTALRDIERKLDATTTRKRLDVSEACSRNNSKVCPTYCTPVSVQPDYANINQLSKTLRVWISNTVEDQAWQGAGLNVDTFDFTSNMEASYRVKIEGRMLDPDENTAAQLPTSYVKMTANTLPNDDGDGDKSEQRHVGSPDSANASTYRFSHFFKALSVEFDRSRFRNGAEPNVEWKKPESSSKSSSGSNSTSATDFDELTFKRNGDENMNIIVNLHRHESPERYELSPELSEVVDMSEATQQEAVAAVWEYIRFWNLQEDEEKRNFRCDELLKKVRVFTRHVP